MSEILSQATIEIQNGNKDKGRELLIPFIKDHPNSERAWGLLYNTCKSDSERLFCLQKILQINPANDKAKKLVSQLSTTLDPLDIPAYAPPNNQESEILKNCPYCAEKINSSAIVCPHCRRDLRVSPSDSAQLNENSYKKREKKWYMETWVKIVTFIFFTPLWTLIVLEDPDSSIGVKIVAGVLLVIYLLAICPAIFRIFG